MPVAMITGGASWISRATAKLLIADGWQVGLYDIDATETAKAVAEVGGAKVASGGLLDVGDLAAVVKTVADLTRDRGPIGALVNVAGGTSFMRFGRPKFVETTPDQWDKVFCPNIYGVLNCVHAVLPGMIEAKKGVIINLTSGLAWKPRSGTSLYSLSTAGLIAFTQSLCQELGPLGIRINSVAPGSTESRWKPDLGDAPFIDKLPPLGRRTKAHEIAEGIVWLISDKASHITGICLDISGGTGLR